MTVSFLTQPSLGGVWEGLGFRVETLLSASGRVELVCLV